MASLPPKVRIDQALVDLGLVPTKSRAAALIMAGKVYEGDRKVLKAGDFTRTPEKLYLKEDDHPWVSRGGLKLVKALELFSIEPKGFIALDVGSSTGGFTDVLLHHGAAKVYAVDVGKNQLDWKLRQDSRVVVLEGVNARYLTAEQIPESIDIVVCDASFISLKTVLPVPLSFAKHGAWLVALIKPQFEVGKDLVGKGGIVRDPALHQEVVTSVRDWLASLPGWTVLGTTESPIEGTKGNKEFLLVARRIG